MKTLKPCPLVMLILFKNVLLPVNTLMLVGAVQSAHAGSESRLEMSVSTPRPVASLQGPLLTPQSPWGAASIDSGPSSASAC